MSKIDCDRFELVMLCRAHFEEIEGAANHAGTGLVINSQGLTRNADKIEDSLARVRTLVEELKKIEDANGV